MRLFTVVSSLGFLLAAAPSGAEPLIQGGGANKFANEDRSALAEGDVRTSDIDAELVHATPGAGASGIKSFGDGGRRLNRAATSTSQARLTGEPTRLRGERSPKGLSTASVRRAATADVPMSIVKRSMSAAPKGAATVKRLATSGGLGLQAAGAKLGGEGVKNLAQ